MFTKSAKMFVTEEDSDADISAVDGDEFISDDDNLDNSQLTFSPDNNPGQSQDLDNQPTMGLICKSELKAAFSLVSGHNMPTLTSFSLQSYSSFYNQLFKI